jgi:predicted membrane channel-forming protein YqfA (hemolysin III family)
MLADLRFLSILVLITATCSTYTVTLALHKEDEQRKREFYSIMIMIVTATIAGICCKNPSPCEHCQKNHAQGQPKQASPAPI